MARNTTLVEQNREAVFVRTRNLEAPKGISGLYPNKDINRSHSSNQAPLLVQLITNNIKVYSAFAGFSRRSKTPGFLAL
jgi:hypothetical protein